MTSQNKRFHALLLVLVLIPLCWIQSADATAVAYAPGGESETDDCGEGCTRTQGYWKNHSAYAGNPNQQIPWPLSEDSLLCDETWHDILHDNPNGGDAWIILAHQWIAARLNEASGASIEDLNGDLDDAGSLLADNCGGIPADLREGAIDLARRLDDFNNGVIGPGHCDDGDVDPCEDCNDNGIDDSIDISEGDSNDGDLNGIPDECEPSITSFCEGIGEAEGGVECPCGNVAPAGTSEGCLNGDGVGAELTATGTPSVSNDTLLLHVDGIPNNKPGFFFQGAADAGPGPFGNGTRCIGGPFIRLAKIAGQPGGNSYPPPGDPPISEEFLIPAGATRYYQVLYRDGQGPCGGTANASNGLKVVWGL